MYYQPVLYIYYTRKTQLLMNRVVYNNTHKCDDFISLDLAPYFPFDSSLPK